MADGRLREIERETTPHGSHGAQGLGDLPGNDDFAGQSDEATSFRILDRAFERGVTFIDTADAYPIPPDPETAGRTEEVIGRWLAAAPGRRHQIVLATKCRIRVGTGRTTRGFRGATFWPPARPVFAGCRPTTIDLYQAHCPIRRRRSTRPCVPSTTWSARVRFAMSGCSNYPAWQLALALATSERHGWARYDCVQPRYNVLYREIENELLPLCRDQGVGVIVYNPLAGGLLDRQTSAPSRGPGAGTVALRWGRRAIFIATVTGTPSSSRRSRRLKSYCQRRGWNLATASVAWVLEQPGITSAIVGASRPEQLEATLDGAELVFDDDARAVFDSVWWSIPRRPLTR